MEAKNDVFLKLLTCIFEIINVYFFGKISKLN